MRVAISVCLSIAPAVAAAEERVDFQKQIQPILQKNCANCHGTSKQKAGLRLETGAQVLKGAVDGAVVVPKKPKDSKIIHALRGENDLERMPPSKALEESEISLIAKWIEQGAAIPDPKNDKGAKHWAFVPPVKAVAIRSAKVRTSEDRTFAERKATVVDDFLEAERNKNGLAAAPLADRETLLRRVTLDLTGLPPTPAEREEFLKDDSPAAFENLVDRLLASPRYGERWGRHWLDVWRYSDWYGWANELRNSQKNIWNWRDWVVESLNENKPYDRMIHEMLAADEISPGDWKSLRATGFIARSYYKFSRNVWLDSIVEHTGKAFLGVTINCAKCHDHMYDPISQQEYFSFRAIFEPHELRMDSPQAMDADKTGIPRVFDAKPNATTFLFERGDEKRPKTDKNISPAPPKELCTSSYAPAAITLPAEVSHPTMRPEVAKAVLAKAQQQFQQAKGEAAVKVATLNLVATKAMLEADKARYSKAPIANDLVRHAVALHLEAKVAAAEADHSAAQAAFAPLEKAAKKDAKAIEAAKKRLKDATVALANSQAAVAKPPADYPPLMASYPEQTSGRRLALAKWITAKENPLTARVFVNHVWLRHFGQPLVPTVFDFGKNGRPPTHPALLDWLAVEFMESGWDIKRLHRLIVTSDAYRMSSTHPGPTGELARKKDPDNLLLWRMNPRPLEAEAVRDSMLAVAGLLESKLGGPEIDEDPAGVKRRRAIYFRHAPEKMSPFLSTMDGASPTECYRRPTTVVPQQAMALVNSQLTAVAAKEIAEQITRSTAKDPTAIAFKQLLGREPMESERRAAQEFLKRQPLSSLVEALFNHVDFTTLR